MELRCVQPCADKQDAALETTADRLTFGVAATSVGRIRAERFSQAVASGSGFWLRLRLGRFAVLARAVEFPFHVFLGSS